jgi:hypothetical protein
MPAPLLPLHEVQKRAKGLDLQQKKALRLVQEAGQITNSDSLDRETFAALQQLAKDDLVDPGYTPDYTPGQPDANLWHWASNPNGQRAVLVEQLVAGRQGNGIEGDAGGHGDSEVRGWRRVQP